MSVNIIVNNKLITKYQHDGNDFVEGWKGSEYAIRIQAPFRSSSRVKAVVSVDGVNVVSNNQEWDQGFILDSKEILDIVGFHKNSTISKFVFGNKNKGISNSSVNAGVIGVMWFREKLKHYQVSRRITYPPIHPYQPDPDPFSTKPWITPSVPYPYPKGTGDYTPNPIWVASSASVNNYQTVLGEKIQGNVSEVDFDSENSAFVTNIIYYDSAQGLTNRGIILKRSNSSLPNAFP